MPQFGNLISKRPTLRFRIVFVLLIASLLPLAIAGFGAWIVFGGLLEEKALEQMKTVVLKHARAIESDLSERIHLLQLAARSNRRQVLSDRDNLQTLFDNLNQISEGSFVDLGVIDADGSHLAYVGPYDLFSRNYRDADWFKEVMNRGVYISDVFLGFRQVPHCIIAVQTGSGRDSWILRATINSERFDALVQSQYQGEGSDIYIVNREGRYQTTPRVGSILDSIPTSMIEFHRGVRNLRVKQDGGTKLNVTTWLNDNRWMLVVEQDLAAVQAPVNRAIASGAQVVVIAAALLVITTFLATSHLTRRIDRANLQREEMTRAFIRSARLASIGELATGLAHEINNPLATMSAEQTNISDLLNGADSEKDWKKMALESVERCQQQIRRCANITKKMLQFGRKRETTLEATDITPRLKEIVNLLRRHAGVRNVELELQLEAKLPQVIIDPIEFEQVIVNLINNSIDALPDGGNIRIRAIREKAQVHLELADNGVGIPPDELSRIFEPFYTTKPVGQGTGLGLSVCYGLVHSWGGRIKAESAEKKGTTMHIYLPLPERERSINKK
jgi:two-component system NtrC family sensor kinase